MFRPSSKSSVIVSWSFVMGLLLLLPLSARALTLGPEGEELFADTDTQNAKLLGLEFKDEAASKEAAAGFQIRIPAGARSIQRAGLELLSFVHDTKQWAGTIQAATFIAEKFSPEEYLKVSVEELGKTFKAVQVLESRPILVSQKPAVRLTASVEAASGQARAALLRQLVAVQVAPNQYITLTLFSPLDETNKADAIRTFDAMLATFEVTDRKQIEARRLQAVKDGHEWLAAHSAEELTSRLIKGPQLFRIKVENRDVGYVQFDEREATQTDFKGIQFTFASWTFPEGRVIHSESTCFWAYTKQPGKPDQDTSFSMWQNNINTTTTPHSGRVVSEWGTETGSLLLETAIQGTRDREVLRDKHYLLTVSRASTDLLANRSPTSPLQWAIGLDRPTPLPKVLEYLYPRLVDLSTPSQRAFSVFNSATSRMGLRTLTVIGPDPLTIDGRTYKTTKILNDIEPGATTLWVDPNGRTILMRTSDNSLLVPTTAEKMQLMWGSRLAKPKSP